MVTPKRKDNDLLIFGVFLTVTVFAGVIIVTDHVTSEAMPVISTVTGFVGLLLVQLRTAASVESKVDRVLNGDMEASIRRVVAHELRTHEIEKTGSFSAPIHVDSVVSKPPTVGG